MAPKKKTSKKAAKLPVTSIRFTEDVLARIDQFQADHGFGSRSSVVVWMVDAVLTKLGYASKDAVSDPPEPPTPRGTEEAQEKITEKPKATAKKTAAKKTAAKKTREKVLPIESPETQAYLEETKALTDRALAQIEDLKGRYSNLDLVELVVGKLVPNAKDEIYLCLETWMNLAPYSPDAVEEAAGQWFLEGEPVAQGLQELISRALQLHEKSGSPCIHVLPPSNSTETLHGACE